MDITPRIIMALFALFIVIALLFSMFRRFKTTGMLSGSIEHRTTPSGQNYYWTYVPPGRNNGGGKCEISIDADASSDFSFDHEDQAHKYAERLGFTRKLLMGDSDFDAQIYVACDDPGFYKKFHASASMRRNVITIFNQGVKSIFSRRGKLVVSLKRIWAMPDAETEEAVVQNLNDLKRQLSPSTMMGDAPVRHPNVLRARLFNGAGIGIFIAGLIIIFGIAVQPRHAVAQTNLIAMAGILALAASIFSLAMIKRVFSGSSLGYKVLKSYLSWGLIGTVLCSYGAVYDANIYYDESDAAVYDQRIIGKYTTHGRHNSSTYYHIRVQDWHLSGKSYSLEVSHDTYVQAQVGMDLLRLWTHPGRLNCEWIERYQLVSR